jgi:regulator of nucleoside diphosphate kinase
LGGALFDISYDQCQRRIHFNIHSVIGRIGRRRSCEMTPQETRKQNTVKGRLPRLVIGSDDYGRLTSMASHLTGSMADVAVQLTGELERARVVTQAKLPADAVRMGSHVAFTTSDGAERAFQLVFPEDADISARRVSVLTPMGAALIGLREGQTIPWTTRDGRVLSLTVVSVRQDA